MKKVILLLVLCVSFLGTAQDKKLFDTATAAYNEGNYNKAIENYLKIVENGQHSAELYFNLGNAYYKLNKIAPSIYYYEKALLLKPNDPEIKNNLGFAQNMTLDAIDKVPEAGFSKIYRSIVGFLTFDQWASLAVVFMILFVLTYIFFRYLRYSSQKRAAFAVSIISLIISVFAVALAYFQYNDFKNDRPAIVFPKEIIVKSEPNKRSQETFRLHQGTKVNVLDQLGDWKKIRLADGKKGWVLSDDIRLLKDF